MKPIWYRRLFTLSLLGLILISTTITAAAQSGQQVRITQVDNSRFPNVTVYVSVTDSAGNPIGVDPATIQISENGQPMQPTEVRGGGDVAGGEATPVTTVLVIDISGSMEKGNKIGAAKDAARTYVNGMQGGDQVGIVTFDSNVNEVQPITSDKSALINAIDGLNTGSDTAMYDAILKAAVSLENVQGRKAVLVLSDGMDNQSSSSENNIVDSVGPSGLTVSAIGFGDPSLGGQSGIDEAGLKSLTGRTGGQYAYVTDASTLTNLYQQYGQSFQSEYAITYVTPSTTRDGVNRGLTVSLANAGVSTEGKYNPGGVLPEVTGQSWSLFAAIALGLLVLLAVPLLFMGGGKLLGGGGGGRKGRIKLASSSGGSSSGSNRARGRVKLR
jgi:VWFA-related protein